MKLQFHIHDLIPRSCIQSFETTPDFEIFKICSFVSVVNFTESVFLQAINPKEMILKFIFVAFSWASLLPLQHARSGELQMENSEIFLDFSSIFSHCFFRIKLFD